MKRCWIGFFLLVLLLLGSILVCGTMVRIHEPAAEGLHQAGNLALSGDWDRAAACFREARKEWSDWEHFRSCFADHSPAEEIDAGFAMLEVWVNAGDRVSFASGCHSLARQIAAMGDAQKPSWWNLL